MYMPFKYIKVRVLLFSLVIATRRYYDNVDFIVCKKMRIGGDLDAAGAPVSKLAAGEAGYEYHGSTHLDILTNS